MSEEEWSLKGKRHRYDKYDGCMESEDSFDWIPKYIDKDIKPDSEYRRGRIYYKYEDIETLREKLIEDVKNRVRLIKDEAWTDDVNTEKDYDAHITNGLIKIINRRFGHE